MASHHGRRDAAVVGAVGCANRGANAEYNEARPHQGRWCFGKTPMQTFLDAMPMTKEKMIAA